MAINLPHWLVEIVDALGFNWPEIDEDQLREAGKHLRSYADECQLSHDRTHGIVNSDLKAVYTAQSYTTLAQVWGDQSSRHMQELIEACRMLADGLEVAAVGVEGMKGKVIAQLAIAAAEFVADQAAAAATFGIAEAAVPALLALQNRIINGILDEFEAEVIGALVSKTITPITEKVDQSVQRLLFAEVGDLAIGGPPPTLALDTHAMRTHAAAIRSEGEANLSGGRDFSNKVGALTFTTGG